MLLRSSFFIHWFRYLSTAPVCYRIRSVGNGRQVAAGELGDLIQLTGGGVDWSAALEYHGGVREQWRRNEGRGDLRPLLLTRVTAGDVEAKVLSSVKSSAPHRGVPCERNSNSQLHL